MPNSKFQPKFNKVWAQGVTEAEFVKAFEDVKEYKGVDLKAEHRKIKGKDKPEVATSEDK